MTLIKVPVLELRQSAMNPDRPVNSLLRAQIQHLQEAEKNLPLRYRTEIYANAIKTEGEAAKYIRAATEAITKAHAEASAQRMRPTYRRERGIEIAAVAESKPVSRSASVATGKRKAAKRNRKT
jgi:hypothetical protein